MMASFDDAVRLVLIQERLRRATYHELTKDGHHKSSEGAVSLSFNLPPVVGDEKAPYWAVEAYSYLLCPDSRSGTWIGKTAGEAIGKAEDAIGKWCLASEMEQFESRFGSPDDAGHPDQTDSSIPE